MQPVIHLIGFGSQGQAWSECLKASGWHVQVYLSRTSGPSFEAAVQQGLTPRLIGEFAGTAATGPEPALVAFLCPDSKIGSIYRDHIARVEHPLTLVLAHGYTIYADDLKPRTDLGHQAALLAPKAIGPQLKAKFMQARQNGGRFHSLVAGFTASAERAAQVRALAAGLGFERLADTTFEQEAIGDMISEQGLLCGGLFTLMEWTLQAMREAGVPPALIREECFTELELVAGLIRERGPAGAYRAISSAAQCGTIQMREKLLASGAREAFQAQIQETLSKKFSEEFRREAWIPKSRALAEHLDELTPSNGEQNS